MKLSEIYLKHFASNDSRIRVAYELANIAKLLGLSDVDKVDWERFERADVIELMAMPAVRCRKPASQNFTLRILKGLCTEAYLNGLLAENRLEAIRNIRNVRGIRQTSRTVPTMNDVSAIIADCEKDGMIGIRDAAIFAVAVGCGLRRTEIVNLRMRDIDFEKHELRIIGKGNKERIIFFSESVSSKLDAWDKLRGNDGSAYFFVPVLASGRLLTSRRMNDETVYQMMRRRSMEALNRVVSPHDMRRSFASTLLDANVDLNTVRIALGHSDIRTTQIYDRRDEIERLKRISAIAVV